MYRDLDRVFYQSLLREVHVWSKLCHRNVLPLLGITTKFDQTVSIVSAWMTPGNAHGYVQNIEVDPRPLVRHYVLHLTTHLNLFQLVGIATGLQYLHSYKPDPIYHGDLKGVCLLSFRFAWSPLTPPCSLMY